MFLFLSKLLPVFLYPLGLSCVLLLMALLISWKRPRLATIPVALALVILLLGSNAWVSETLVKSLEWQNIPQGELPSAQAIVILGGSTGSASSPRPMVEINENGDRVLYGAKLYRDRKAPIVIPAGGRIDWIDGGTPESEDMATLLEMMGVAAEDIIEEPDSLNTYQNAVNVKRILDEQGINRVLLVTSARHMPRSLLVFKNQGIEAIPAPADFLVVQTQEDEDKPMTTQKIVLRFLPNTERLHNTTKAIKEYIGIVVYRLRGWL